MLELIPLELLEPWIEGDWIDAIVGPYTTSPYMGDLVFFSMLIVGLGLSMYIHTDGVAVPIVITMVFASGIGAAIGGTIATVVVAAMVLIIPGVLLVLIMRGRR